MANNNTNIDGIFMLNFIGGLHRYAWRYQTVWGGGLKRYGWANKNGISGRNAPEYAVNRIGAPKKLN